MSYNVWDIRSFSGTKWKKNLGEGRAEPRTVYPLLYAPTTKGRRAQRGTERSGVSSKNIFRSQLSDRLSLLIINLFFSYLKNERGVRGEFHFSKLI
jgi:integrase